MYFHISRVHHEVFVLRDAKNILSPPGWFMLHPRPGKSRGRTIFDRGFSSLGKQATPKHREALRSEPVFQIWWHRTLAHSSLVDAWRSTCVSRTTHAIIFLETTLSSPRRAAIEFRPRQDVVSSISKAIDVPRRSQQNRCSHQSIWTQMPSLLETVRLQAHIRPY